MKLHLSFDGTGSLKFQASGMEEKPFFMEDHMVVIATHGKDF